MFPIHLQSEQNLYAVPKSASKASVDIELDRQLQTELAKAIEATMASSKSQELIAQTKDFSIKKRKSSQEPKPNPISDDTKRRRISIESEVIVLSNKLDARLDVPDEKTFLNKDTEDDATHTTTTNKAENVDEQTSTGMTEQKILPETEKDLNMGESATKLSAFSTNGKSVLHRIERKKVDIENELPKRIHKRFGSEDIQSNLSHTESRDIVAVQGIDSQEDVQANNDSHESEDDAPETVTAATGLAQARLAISQATKIAERQRTVLRKKRKERDNLLKMQAESARKPKEDDQRKTRSPSQDITSDSVTINSHEAPNQELYLNNAPLPALLPDDILAEEPLSKTSTLPMNPSIPKSSLKTKLKLLDKNSNSPKVIRHGLVDFQVLEVPQGHLPPKASKNSKHIRESWLLGQRGKSIVPRKRLGGGFVRKSLSGVTVSKS